MTYMGPVGAGLLVLYVLGPLASPSAPLGVAWEIGYFFFVLRFAAEAELRLRIGHAPAFLYGGLVAMTLAFTVMQVSALLITYPPMLYVLNLLVQLVAVAYILLASTKPELLIRWASRNR